MVDRASVLILGGTSEAAALARAFDIRFGTQLRVVTSLAGRTRSPHDVPGEIRSGGFGGPDGLAAYLRDERFSALIDATHPFANRISENAYVASQTAGIPRLRLDRPVWQRAEGDDWHPVATAGDAARLVTRMSRRIFLTVGSRDLDAFSGHQDHWFLVRVVDPPARPLPLVRFELLAARGPFNAREERALMLRHEIDALVCKASGGDMTYPKLAAARDLGLPVVMIERPPPPPGKGVRDVDSAVEWFLDLCAGNAGTAETGRSE